MIIIDDNNNNDNNNNDTKYVLLGLTSSYIG